MPLYLSEKEGDRMVDGLKGCSACIHQGRDTMEVWCEEGEEFYGFLPSTATPDTIHYAAGFYKNGLMAGCTQGAREARAKVRAALAD